MYILTVRYSYDNVVSDSNHFLGIFPEFSDAKKEINKHLKSARLVDSYNKGKAKKGKQPKFSSQTYLIHCPNPLVKNTPEDCEGTYTEFTYSNRSNKLRQTMQSSIMRSFTALCSPMKSVEKEVQLEKIAKQCNGEITGSGCGFGEYDFSVLIPLEHAVEFKALMKEAKFKCKDQGKVSPYIY